MQVVLVVPVNFEPPGGVGVPSLNGGKSHFSPRVNLLHSSITARALRQPFTCNPQRETSSYLSNRGWRGTCSYLHQKC
jgi:hypothetical protein